MIYSRTRTRLRSVSSKRMLGTPGGEYQFRLSGKDYSLPGRFLQDPESPDGMRWVATPDSNKIIRRIVCQMANSRCEWKLVPHCWGYLPLEVGHPHHSITKGMGGAHSDDRIFVGGEQIRFWVCPTCHRAEHGDVQWSEKVRSA